MHNATPIPDRFWSHVAIGSLDECWPWMLRLRSTGYGQFKMNRKTLAAHRVAYELAFGPIPHGLQIDHECHNADQSCHGGSSCPHRRCVNPGHLRAVTSYENSAASMYTTASINRAKTHCKRGHEYTPENTYTFGNDWRQCRACNRLSVDKYQAAQGRAS